MFQKVCMLYKNHLPCSKAINHNLIPREISITPWCSHVGFWLGISISSKLMSHTEILILSTNPNYRLSRFLMQNGWCTIMRPKTVSVHLYRFRPGNQASPYVNYDILVYSWYGIFYLKAVLLQAKKKFQWFSYSHSLLTWNSEIILADGISNGSRNGRPNDVPHPHSTWNYPDSECLIAVIWYVGNDCLCCADNTWGDVYYKS